ncbi:MAG: (4Fe-4S)-binding protein [candidate division NC10 bacterium]|nr:(4Fe-4S)-binding protein [candidate division NC10 bacterium]
MTGSIEVVYRGIFQKTLGQRITRGIVLAAVKEGRVGISFGRYGDSPERNGIPAKSFAVVADNEEDLQTYLSRYEPTDNDVTVAVDDTLCKGVESWAWYGLQPINKLTRSGGVVLTTSMQSPEELLEDCHRKDTEWSLAVLKGIASFSGLWVYKDDHTDVRVLGAIARLAPHVVKLESVEAAIRDEWNDELKVTSARKAYERVEARKVRPDEGNPERPYEFQLPKWWEMKEGLVIPGIPVQQDVEGWEGGYRPGRNPTFKKFATRTMRPVVDFEICTKCTLCWLQCPDSCFDVTPTGHYDANMEACCGCGVCEAVCPVENCITMVNESAFGDNASQFEMYEKDKDTYKSWLKGKIEDKATTDRTHGFQLRGKYEEEVQEIIREVTK